MNTEGLDTEVLFASVATSDDGDPAVGVVWWARHPMGSFAATILDYKIAEISDIDANWMADTFGRGAELAAQHRPTEPGCNLRVEQPGLRQVLEGANAAYRDSPGQLLNEWRYRVEPVRKSEAQRWPATFIERAAMVRQLVNSGRVIRAETGMRRFTFRAIKANHLISEIQRFQPSDAPVGSGLLTAFVLGTLIAATKRSVSTFDRFSARTPASGGSFGAYIRGERPR